MPMRGRLAFLVALGCAAVAVLAVLASGRSRVQRPGYERPTATGFVGSLRPARMGARDFALRDERGRQVRLASLRGRAVALAFVYATCRDTCPVTAQQVRGALDQVGRRRAAALFVSVDPPRDTPSTAARFLTD